ncbi:MAG: hypothetical protein ACI4GW_00975 [Lachnospiraceae bacterium]
MKVIRDKMIDYRIELLKEYQELLQNWEKNNILYNSLRFYQLYNGDVENSELVSRRLGKNNETKNDIMTSWWKPTKYFLLKNKKGNRDELTQQLLVHIPRENNVDNLQISLSQIRYSENLEKSIDKAVIDAFLDFLNSIYSLGNMTNAARTTTGGPLDNWDGKLLNIKRTYNEKEWKKYVETNSFQDYFEDDQYSKIIPFWNYGGKKLAEASDEDWKEYFINVKKRIEQREQRLLQFANYNFISMKSLD